MFKRGYISITDLDEYRDSIGRGKSGEPDNDADKKTRDDLGELHCIDFKRLPVEVLAELPARVGQYIGVELYSIVTRSCKLIQQRV